MDSAYIKNIMGILIPATLDTLYMLFWTTIFSTIIGFVLGTILYTTKKDGIIQNKKVLNNILGILINIGRSIPFVILIIAFFPLSDLIVGTSLGRKAAVVPLTIAAIPFIARLVEASFNEVNKGVIEVAITFGATPLQIIYKILIPETVHMQILNITTASINIVGYTAMAGLVGGGGLGDVALRYGYQRFQNDILIYTIILLIIIVYVIQFVGTRLSNKFNKS